MADPGDKAVDDQSSPAKKESPTATKHADNAKFEPKIMLKRSILKELLIDPDFKQIGLYGSTASMSGPAGTILASKY